MSKKSFFVILWLTFLSVFAFAQVPEQTTTKSQPCWKKEVQQGVSEENKSCYKQFLQEVDRQIKAGASKEVLEDLELAGVNFVKAIGLSEAQAGEMVSGYFIELQLRNVPLPKQEVVTPAPAPTPTVVVSEETETQVGFAKRSDPAKQDALRSERQEGWKAGLPQLETNTGSCWEETHPNDLTGCITQLEQYINQVKDDKSLPSGRRRLAVTNLRVYMEKLKKLEKSAEKVLKTQRTWATSRTIAGVGEVCPQIWVHEGYAGPGWRAGLGHVVIHLINNTGVMIDKVVISGGAIIQRVCPGATVTFHLTSNGSPYANFFVSAETAGYEGGVRKVLMWSRDYGVSATSINREDRWELTLNNKQNSY